SIADQTAGQGELAPLINRRNSMAGCQCYNLIASAVKERIGTDEKSIRVTLNEGRERVIDFAFSTGFEDLEPHAPSPRRFQHVSDRGVGIRSGRVHDEG